MTQTLDGATRLHYIVGDPIAQVKSPAGVTQAFADHGRNAVCVPAHVSPAHLADWVRGASLAQNVDGIIVTVPHKFACTDLCVTVEVSGVPCRPERRGHWRRGYVTDDRDRLAAVHPVKPSAPRGAERLREHYGIEQGVSRRYWVPRVADGNPHVVDVPDKAIGPKGDGVGA